MHACMRGRTPLTHLYYHINTTAALRRVAQAVSRFMSAQQGLLRSLLPESREAALRALARLHLMLFFFNGRCVVE